eukprot:1178380-Prorocentrum_minimum.AAC.1
MAESAALIRAVRLASPKVRHHEVLMAQAGRVRRNVSEMGSKTGSVNPLNRSDGFASANGKALLRVRFADFLGSAKIRKDFLGSAKRTRSRAFPLAEANPSDLFNGFAEPIFEPISETFLLTRPARARRQRVLMTALVCLHGPACNVSRAQEKSSGRKWGTGHRARKGEGKLGVLSAPLPFLAQEDP